MSPRVEALIAELAEMDASEVEEVRRGLQRMFGLDEDDGMGVREPSAPRRPIAFGMCAREIPRN